MQRLALEVGRQAVLPQVALGELADHAERVCVLRRARLVDHVDHLDRVLDPHVLRHMEERAAGPERRRRGGELAFVLGQALHVPLLDELGVLGHSALQGREDHALVGER